MSEEFNSFEVHHPGIFGTGLLSVAAVCLEYVQFFYSIGEAHRFGFGQARDKCVGVKRAGGASKERVG